MHRMCAESEEKTALVKSPTTRRQNSVQRSWSRVENAGFLDAWVAVTEATWALGDLLLLDGDDVDWDAVEL